MDKVSGYLSRNASPGMGRLRDGAALVSLLLVLLVAFWHIGPAGRVLAGGDLFGYFYPYWAEATRALRAGQWPLWNPYLFMGAPLLANSQVGLFYPLNWLLWLTMPAHRALHWSILLHLALAATGAYVYARRSLRLGRLGAWTAGAALALGGYLGAQVEHINQLQALAWFPWLLTLSDCLREGKRRRFAFSALAAVTGLMLLAGHSQSSFIALTALAVYALAPATWAAFERRTWGELARQAATLAVAVLLGAALAAVQLAPTLELAGLSLRAGGLPFNERLSFSLSPLYLARALLPGYGQAVEPARIEYVAAVGVVGLVVLLATAAAWRRREGRPGGPLLVAALGLFLALGLYNPLYLLLARFVPGFAHFRAPARWLALWAFGAATLIGWGVDALAAGRARPDRRAWALGGGALALLLAWGALGGRAELLTLAGWLVAAALAMGLVALTRRTPRLAALGLSALLAVELILSARVLPHARATAPQAYTSLRPAAAHLLAAGEGETPPPRFLSLSARLFDPGDLAEMQLIYGPQLSPEALYDLTVAAKYREVLALDLPLVWRIPAVDGYDGGLLPLARYLLLQRVLLPEEEIALDGRLRENLPAVPDGRWLGLFNVRYVITDKVFDAWLDDIFYDLQFGATLAAGEEAEVAYVPPFEATALGLVSYLDGAAALGDGTVVGQVVVGFADGVTRTFTLRAGVETAEGLYGEGVAHGQAEVGGHFWPGQPAGNDYTARLRWEPAARPQSVRLRATLPTGQLVVRGLSLVDERSGAFQSLVLSDRGRFRLVHSGDVKVYEYLDVLPRAFVVHRVWAAPGAAAALARMQAADFDPATEAVIEGEAGRVGLPRREEAVRIVSYAAERVEVEVDLDAAGYLVLSDAFYPGWQAWVDGEAAEIEPADLLFRAVHLEAGAHRVVFTFASPLFRLGGWISLAAGIFLLIAARFNARP